MMGYSHAISGAMAASVVAAFQPALIAPNPQTYTMSCLLAAGAAVMADADHPNARAAKTFGPVVNVIGAVSGGHRHGTHTVWAAGLVAAACWGASLWTLQVAGVVIYPVGFLVVFIAMGLGLAALTGLNRWIVLSVAAVVAAGAAVLVPDPLWLTIVVGGGYLVHLLGDILTTKGVAVFRPLPPTIRVPLLGDAGSMREAVLVALMIGVWAVLTFTLVVPGV